MEREASRTAMRVAVLRAAHQLIDGEPKILDDRVSAHLLDAQTFAGIGANPDLRSSRLESLRVHVLLRSRYSEERLEAAARDGVRQCVILGAGFDTFAYRQPAWSRALRIIEVDHPSSQRAKRDRLRAAAIAVPDNVSFIPIDFETTSLAAGLAAAGFDRAQRSFFSWLGVMVYLKEPAIDAVLSYVASLPAGSQIVFSFGSSDPTAAGEEDARLTAEAVAALGEPWLTRSEPGPLGAKLREAGFSEVSFLTPPEANARYLTGRSDGLPLVRRISVGSATV